LYPKIGRTITIAVTEFKKNVTYHWCKNHGWMLTGALSGWKKYNKKEVKCLIVSIQRLTISIPIGGKWEKMVELFCISSLNLKYSLKDRSET